MADLDISPFHGTVDKRRGRGLAASDPMTEKANLLDIPTMRTRLAALNATYYTNARLNNMTKNDMVFALRDAGAI